MAEKLKLLSWRDIVFVGLPICLAIVAAFWLTAQFIKPAPPTQLVFSTGGETGAYQRFAASYKDVLARYGIELVAKPSAGSIENLTRLRDPAVAVDAAFIQGGTAHISDEDALFGLGDFYYEPLWVFYRESLARKRPLDRLKDLKGRRIAIGAAGSGTQYLARETLQAEGVNADNSRLLETGDMTVIGQLAAGKLDAVMVVGPTQSSLIWALLYTPGVRIMSLSRAEAYTRHFPHLSKLILPRGSIDLVRNIPATDVQLVSPMTTLMVREDTHPALIGLLMQAATEVHGGSGAFRRPGEFPRLGHSEFPLSPEAERYYKSGKPFLQRYLPFWAATLIDRAVVMLVPIIAVLFPLFRFAPSLYGWRVRSRIYRRYGELKFLESELEEHPDRLSRDEWLARLDAIEADVHRISAPLTFADMVYTLRTHIALVRNSVMRLKPA